MRKLWSTAALCLAPLLTAAAPSDDGALTRYTSTLIDQSGHAIPPARFAGKFILVNLIFTGCGSTCPTQTAELVKFDRSLPLAKRAKLTLL